MSDHSHIEWTDATWPIVQGCDPVSQGCVGCYAVPLLWRMMHHPDPKISGPLQGVVEKHVNAAGEKVLRFTGKLALREDRLDWPLKWRQPKMIFVPSHGDIFHKDVPDSFLDKIFAVMALCPQHTFQVLTKRAERMREYFGAGKRQYLDVHPQEDREIAIDKAMNEIAPAHWCKRELHDYAPDGLPPPNVWLGVSAEDQANADERITLLLQTPAAVRFVSLEPLLGAINLRRIRPSPFPIDALTGGWGVPRNDDAHHKQEDRLHWVIAGGESGPKARPMHPDWARSLRDQCKAAGVAFFFKQWGEWAIDYRGGVMPENDPRQTWIGKNGRTFKPSAPQDQDCYAVARVGKKAAGRLLDGIEHNGFPPRTSPQ